MLVRRVAGCGPFDGLGHPLLRVAKDRRSLCPPVADVACRDLLGQRLGPGGGLVVEAPTVGPIVRAMHYPCALRSRDDSFRRSTRSIF